MTTSVSIASLFQRVFGKTTAFDPEFAPLPPGREVGEFGSPYWGKGEGGRDYYMPVEINVGRDNAEKVGIKNRDGSNTGRWNLPHPVISVRANINIIDTVLTERRGVVSEFINLGGWAITIRGLMIGPGNDFPEEDFSVLTKIVALGKPIRITSVLTDRILMVKERNGMDEVVIRSFDFPGIPGVQHVRGYTLELTSNEPFNLIEV